jgi:hypothetical protein
METARDILKLVPVSGSRSPRKNLAPVWQGQQYPKHDEGVRLVRVAKIHGPQWVNRYRRWSIRLVCLITDELGEVSYFMNMGDKREGPRAGRQSNYYKAWTLANGQPPRKGESMIPEVFLDKFFRVRIEDCRRDSDEKEKPEGDVYSHVSELLELVTP